MIFRDGVLGFKHLPELNPYSLRGPYDAESRP